MQQRASDGWESNRHVSDRRSVEQSPAEMFTNFNTRRWLTKPHTLWDGYFGDWD